MPRINVSRLTAAPKISTHKMKRYKVFFRHHFLYIESLVEKRGLWQKRFEESYCLTCIVPDKNGSPSLRISSSVFSVVFSSIFRFIIVLLLKCLFSSPKKYFVFFSPSLYQRVRDLTIEPWVL